MTSVAVCRVNRAAMLRSEAASVMTATDSKERVVKVRHSDSLIFTLRVRVLSMLASVCVSVNQSLRALTEKVLIRN